MLPFYMYRLNLWRSAIKMLLKLKWFFFSILLIYFFFTPNLPVEQQKDFILPEQLLPGFFRISVLIVILFAVNLFIRTTTKEQILAALLWLFSPLQRFQVDVERISLRAVLTLEYIEVLTLRMSDYKNKKKQPQNYELHWGSHSAGQILRERLQQKKSAFYLLINQSGIILSDILTEAKETSGKSYKIECLQSPFFIQYLIPVVIFLLLQLTL